MIESVSKRDPPTFELVNNRRIRRETKIEKGTSERLKLIWGLPFSSIYRGEIVALSTLSGSHYGRYANHVGENYVLYLGCGAS